MSDSEQCLNRLELYLISLLVNFSCELGQIMARYDFLWARWVTNTYGDTVYWRFGGYECRLAANAVVLVLRGYQISISTYLRGIYPHIKFERDPLNIFLVKSVNIVRVYERWRRWRRWRRRRRGGGGFGDAKSIISPNTSFGDIITHKVLMTPLCRIDDSLFQFILLCFMVQGFISWPNIDVMLIVINVSKKMTFYVLNWELSEPTERQLYLSFFFELGW